MTVLALLPKLPLRTPSPAADCPSALQAQPRVRLDEAVQKRLIYSIRGEPTVSESWFDEAQQAVYCRFLVSRGLFLVSFFLSGGHWWAVFRDWF